MTALYDPDAKKKATNLSINSDLLQKAKELKINISSCLEKTLAQLVREKEIQNWEEQNKKSLDSYNDRITKNGLFSDDVRSF